MKGSSTIVTLLFPKASFTPSAARRWATAHQFRAPKIDEGGPKAKMLRIRQRETSAFQKGSFRTILLSEGEGVEAVIGIPKRKNPESTWRILHGSSQVSYAKDKADAYALARKYGAWVQRYDADNQEWHTVSAQSGEPINEEGRTARRIIRSYWGNHSLTAAEIARIEYISLKKAELIRGLLPLARPGDLDGTAEVSEKIQRILRRPG